MRKIPFGKPILGEPERAAVADVLNGPILTHGPRVKEFESAFARYTRANHAIATASCTASLHLAYFYLKVGPGDEVIVPAQTHVATAHAVELCGGRPVFVDSESRTGNIDIDAIETAINERTRAISVVHYLGMPADMERIVALAKRYSLFVVEDCALALGTYYKGIHAGLWGDVGCFSFYPVKHMTTAEGGMLTTQRSEVADEIAQQRAFGIDRNIVAERPVPGVYDVQGLGFNYRMNELEAAIGIEQLKRMPDFLAVRKRNYEALSSGLAELDELELLKSTDDSFVSSHYCHVMILKEPLQSRRVDVIELLGKCGVGTSIYYPKPVPHMTYYKERYGYDDGSFPVASRLSQNGIALPVGPHIAEDDVDYMVESIKNVIAKVR